MTSRSRGLFWADILDWALDAELMKHVKPVQGALLRQAAAVLKTGIRAMHLGQSAPAWPKDDLLPTGAS